MGFKFSVRNFFLGIILSLIMVTILSMMFSSFTDSPVLKTGNSFLLIFVGVFISVIFLASVDKRIEKKEIWTLVLVAILLTVAFIGMKTYIPEIFSALPSQTQEVFSAFGGGL